MLTACFSEKDLLQKKFVLLSAHRQSNVSRFEQTKRTSSSSQSTCKSSGMNITVPLWIIKRKIIAKAMIEWKTRAIQQNSTNRDPCEPQGLHHSSTTTEKLQTSLRPSSTRTRDNFEQQIRQTKRNNPLDNKDALNWHSAARVCQSRSVNQLDARRQDSDQFKR